MPASRLLPARTTGTGNLQVRVVFDTLHEIAGAAGAGSQGRKLELLAGLLREATPLEARYQVRTVTGNLRLGIGTAVKARFDGDHEEQRSVMVTAFIGRQLAPRSSSAACR